MGHRNMARPKIEQPKNFRPLLRLFRPEDVISFSMQKLLILFVMVFFYFVIMYIDTLPMIGGEHHFVKDFLNIYCLSMNIYPDDIIIPNFVIIGNT